MSTISGRYSSSSEVWDTLAQDAILGSHQLSSSSSETKVVSCKEGQGSYGALVMAVESSSAQKVLDAKAASKWKSLLMEDSASSSSGSEEDSEKVKKFLENLSVKLADCSKDPTDAKLVSLLADIGIDIEAENLFSPVGRKMAHLMMNYVASYFGRPILVFQVSEKNDYASGVKDLLKMRLLLAEKIRERVFYFGEVYQRTSSKATSERYRCVSSLESTAPLLTIEWHQLFKDVEAWKSEAKTK